MSSTKNVNCPECEQAFNTESHGGTVRNRMQRREFLSKLGAASAAITTIPLFKIASPVYARGPNEKAEVMVRELRDSLSQEQRTAILLDWNDPRRLGVENNWRVVPQRIGRFYSKDQGEIILEILRGVTSEEGYEKILKAMRDDDGGIGNYSACLFSDGAEKLAFMLTGRHQTIRADGGAEKSAVFGGPIFYGHAVSFRERPDHPGNVWWHQSRLASKVYKALDGKQQERALVTSASPADSRSSIRLKGENGIFQGIPVSELSSDQKELVEDVMRSLMEPYRSSDVEEVLASIKTNGGMDKLHISFYKQGDLPDKDGIWDRWKLEGPSFVWYFRGSPHVHTWINIAHTPSA